MSTNTSATECRVCFGPPASWQRRVQRFEGVTGVKPSTAAARMKSPSAASLSRLARGGFNRNKFQPRDAARPLSSEVRGVTFEACTRTGPGLNFGPIGDTTGVTCPCPFPSCPCPCPDLSRVHGLGLAEGWLFSGRRPPGRRMERRPPSQAPPGCTAAPPLCPGRLRRPSGSRSALGSGHELLLGRLGLPPLLRRGRGSRLHGASAIATASLPRPRPGHPAGGEPRGGPHSSGASSPTSCPPRLPGDPQAVAPLLRSAARSPLHGGLPPAKESDVRCGVLGSPGLSCGRPATPKSRAVLVG